MKGGWAKDWRSGWTHPVFRTLQEAAVFKWMCAQASYAPRRISTRYGPVDLQRGEILISERFLAEQFGLHKNVIRRLKGSLIDEGMIVLFQDRCAKLSGTIALIVNYNEYQGDSTDEMMGQDHLGTINGTATGPLRDRDGTTREEVKELKKDNIDLLLDDEPVSKRESEFNKFWDVFAYKNGRAPALKSWMKISGYDDALFVQILAGAKRDAAARPDLIANGGTPKMAQGWITDRRWEDEAALGFKPSGMPYGGGQPYQGFTDD